MNFRYAVLVALTLGACSGNPFTEVPDDGSGGVDGGGTTSAIPQALRRDLNSATYSAANDTLLVELDSLDASPINGSFSRDRSLDVPGYEAFTFQEATTQRSFIGLFAKSGGVIAGTVGDGGQFSNTVVGGIYAQDGTYSRPASGLATYRGTYAGLLNTGSGGGALEPATPFRTAGTVLVNADFTNNVLNGGITGRRVVDTNTAMRDVFLEITGIAADSTFTGTIMAVNNGVLGAVGTYGGIFGGSNANDLATILVFTPVSDSTTLIEQGAFAVSCVDTFAPGGGLDPTGVPCAN